MFDFRLPDLDGKPVPLSDLRGKITIVAFAGTWCLPFRKEVPHFVELYKSYHDKGLNVVGLHFEESTGEAAASSFGATSNAEIPYPCLLGDPVTRAKVPDFEGFPTTLFLDREGKVRAVVADIRPTPRSTRSSPSCSKKTRPRSRRKSSTPSEKSLLSRIYR